MKKEDFCFRNDDIGDLKAFHNDQYSLMSMYSSLMKIFLGV